MIQLPDKFVHTVRTVHKENGDTWLTQFNDLIHYCEKRWSMKVQPPFELSFNFVAPAILHDGMEVVLKLSVPGDEFLDELEALRLFKGKGMADLIDYDTEKGIIILERISPGNTLAALEDDEEATRLAAKVLKQLWAPDPDKTRIPTTVVREKGLAKYLEKYPEGLGPFSKDTLNEAADIFYHLNRTIQKPYLLHGDIHHFNILSAGRDSWKAIDPKGLIGEREYDLIQFMLNEVTLEDMGEKTEKRVDIFVEELGLDKERLLLWGICHTTLSACWSIEDEMDFEESSKMVDVFKGLYNRDFG